MVREASSTHHISSAACHTPTTPRTWAALSGGAQTGQASRPGHVSPQRLGHRWPHGRVLEHRWLQGGLPGTRHFMRVCASTARHQYGLAQNSNQRTAEQHTHNTSPFVARSFVRSCWKGVAPWSPRPAVAHGARLQRGILTPIQWRPAPVKQGMELDTTKSIIPANLHSTTPHHTTALPVAGRAAGQLAGHRHVLERLPAARLCARQARPVARAVAPAVVARHPALAGAAGAAAAVVARRAALVTARQVAAAVLAARRVAGSLAGPCVRACVRAADGHRGTTH